MCTGEKVYFVDHDFCAVFCSVVSTLVSPVQQGVWCQTSPTNVWSKGLAQSLATTFFDPENRCSTDVTHILGWTENITVSRLPLNMNVNHKLVQTINWEDQSKMPELFAWHSIMMLWPSTISINFFAIMWADQFSMPSPRLLMPIIRSNKLASGQLNERTNLKWLPLHLFDFWSLRQLHPFLGLSWDAVCSTMTF